MENIWFSIWWKSMWHIHNLRRLLNQWELWTQLCLFEQPSEYFCGAIIQFLQNKVVNCCTINQQAAYKEKLLYQWIRLATDWICCVPNISANFRRVPNYTTKEYLEGCNSNAKSKFRLISCDLHFVIIELLPYRPLIRTLTFSQSFPICSPNHSCLSILCHVLSQVCGRW